MIRPTADRTPVPTRLPQVHRARSVTALALTALALITLATPGCRSVTDPAPPADVSAFLDRIERVYVEAELAREQMLVANELLQTIVQRRYPEDPLSTLKQYIEATRRSIAQNATLAAAIEPLKQAARPYFASWVNDLGGFSDSSLWQRSQVRLMAARRRYDGWLLQLEAIARDHATFNRKLLDHSLFLRNDFNESALLEIRPDVLALDQAAQGLTRDYDTCLQSTRSYLASAALPRPAAPVAGAAEAGEPGAAAADASFDQGPTEEKGAEGSGTAEGKSKDKNRDKGNAPKRKSPPGPDRG